jgi:aryl-alcohol dehydrogenase-like predicted oxidoreductase
MSFIKKFTLGTANLSINYGLKNNIVNKNDLDKVFNFLIENNLLSIDTAPSYKNENVLSKYIDNNWHITSKILSLKNSSKNIKNINQNIKKHILKLNLKKIDCLLIHDLKDIENFGEEIWSELKKLKKENVVSKIGISLYDNLDYIDFIENVKPDTIQIPANVFDRRFLNKKFLNIINKYKIGIQARSIFLQGLLLNINLYKKKFVNQQKVLDDYNNWLIKNKINPLEASLSFISKYKFINNYIFGIDNFNNLKQICHFLSKNNTLLIPKKFEVNDLNLINPYNW